MLGLFVSILMCWIGCVRSAQFNSLWLTFSLPLYHLFTFFFIRYNFSSNLIRCKLVTWKYIRIHSLGSFHSISLRLSANLVLPPQHTILNALSLFGAFFSPAIPDTSSGRQCVILIRASYCETLPQSSLSSMDDVEEIHQGEAVVRSLRSTSNSPWFLVLHSFMTVCSKQFLKLPS